MKDYYGPRWQLFLQALNTSLVTKTPFNETKYNNDCISIEYHWNLQQNSYPITPHNDIVIVSNQMFSKYGHYFHKSKNEVFDWLMQSIQVEFLKIIKMEWIWQVNETKQNETNLQKKATFFVQVHLVVVIVRTAWIGIKSITELVSELSLYKSSFNSITSMNSLIVGLSQLFNEIVSHPKCPPRSVATKITWQSDQKSSMRGQRICIFYQLFRYFWMPCCDIPGNITWWNKRIISSSNHQHRNWNFSVLIFNSL